MIEIRHKKTGHVLLRLDADTLAGAYLAGANLTDASLAGLDLTDAELHGARLDGADLQRARLCWADLRGARLEQASLRGADLTEANLDGALCAGADFTRAILRGTSFDGADLESACLRETCCVQGQSYTSFYGANLTRADLRAADLEDAWLEGATLIEANLARTDLWKAHFRYSDLAGVRMNGALALLSPWPDVRPDGFDPLQHGARCLTPCLFWGRSLLERIGQAILPSRRGNGRLPVVDNRSRPQLKLQVDDPQEEQRAKELLEKLAGYVGGFAILGAQREVILWARHASEAELRELWRRIDSGESPGAAWRAVSGPSFQFRQRLLATPRPGKAGEVPGERIVVRHRKTGEDLLSVAAPTLAGACLTAAELEWADLAGADLQGAELQGCKLDSADLTGARLSQSDARGARLFSAGLRGADLSGADFRGASLAYTDLTEANLTGANLAGAKLHGSDLRGADLTGANVMGASLDAEADRHTRWPTGFEPRRHHVAQIGWLLPGLETEPVTVDENLAVEIAKQAVAVNDGWTDCVCGGALRDSNAWVDDGWLVSFRRIDGYDENGEPFFYLGCGMRRVVVIDLKGYVVYTYRI